jgi:hypothetical protein
MDTEMRKERMGANIGWSGRARVMIEADVAERNKD